MARPSKYLDYAVYPPDFHRSGFCWTFRRVSKARSKAKSLGVDSWIRRYAVKGNDRSTQRDWKIVRLWLWNGTQFIRIREEPELFHLPGPTFATSYLHS